MLPYVVLFAALLFFVIRGQGWLDEIADRQKERMKKPARIERGKTNGVEEARRLEVYKRFLENEEDPPDET